MDYDTLDKIRQLQDRIAELEMEVGVLKERYYTQYCHACERLFRKISETIHCELCGRGVCESCKKEVEMVNICGRKICTIVAQLSSAAAMELVSSDSRK
jgi:rRNA maturation endonuclease Nob1